MSSLKSQRRAYAAVSLIPLAVGLMMAIALLPVMLIGYLGARDNTGRLLTQNRDALIDGLEQQLRITLDGAAAQMAAVAKQIEERAIDPDDREGFGQYMAGIVQGNLSMASVGWMERDGPIRRWTRESIQEESNARELITDADGLWARAEAGRAAHWNNPVISRLVGEAVIPRVHPVMRNGQLKGVLIVVLTSESVTPVFDRMEAGITPFVLVGRDRVLIHRNLRMGSSGMDGRLPRLEEVGDPALAVMWRDPRRPAQDVPGRSQVHWSWLGDGYAAQVFGYRTMTGYGDDPWLVGFHQSSLATFRERWVIQALLWGSLALFLVAVGASYLLAGRVVRPAGEIATAARALEQLDFDAAQRPNAERSRIAEVRDIAQALARTAVALRRFETYMPRTLVRRLIAMDTAATEASDREVTVLFMDLANYSGFSDGRSAREVSAFLNEIFGRIGPIIESGGGTIDKYTGDGLMAVWGVPVADPDHVRAAFRTALMILDRLTPAIAADLARDPTSCRMRLGLHTGRVLAGDLGFKGRIDYTIVGRTVNIAQRCQAALKGRMGDAPVGLAITESVRAALDLPREGLAPLEPVRGEPTYRVIWLSEAAGAHLRRADPAARD
jgi:class 3 adenylate cyclase